MWGPLRFSTHAPHQCCALGRVFNTYACITHLHKYVWDTRMQWLSLDTLSLAWLWAASLYIFVGPRGRPSFRPTTRKVTRVDIFFFFASSYRIVGRPIPSLIKFERMLCVVNPRSVWGFYGSKAWCHIKFAHWVFKHHTHHFHIHTWATCTEWVCLHTVLPREVIGDKLAHFAGPCGRPSL